MASVAVPASAVCTHENAVELPLIAIATVLGCVAALLRVFGGVHITDDAYITFRYVEHLAAGQGFEYNAGQHVLGTTTPLYTLLLAFLTKLTSIDLPTMSLAISATADGLTTAMLFLLILRASGNPLAATLGSVTFAVTTGSIQYAESGMETSLFTFLLVATCAAYVADRPVVWGGLAGLALLTRPEAALLFVVLVADYLWRARGRPPARALAAFASIALPWVVWASWYFGQPLPQSVIAKTGAVYHTEPMTNAHAIAGAAGSLLLGPTFREAGVALLLLSGIAAFRSFRANAPGLCPAVVFVMLFIAGYSIASVRGNWMNQWYPQPLVPFYILALFAGLDAREVAAAAGHCALP